MRVLYGAWGFLLGGIVTCAVLLHSEPEWMTRGYVPPRDPLASPFVVSTPFCPDFDAWARREAEGWTRVRLRHGWPEPVR